MHTPHPQPAPGSSLAHWTDWLAGADITLSLTVWRNDLGYEEIREAAMLHDLAEMLAWCFAPQPLMQIAQRQAANPALRSATLQDAILGFRLADLQMALAERWHLPGLLVSMMDDAHAAQPRERCVSCAVSVARHAAHGWDDAALPDDYQAIADLLQITPERAHELVRSVD